MFAAVHASVFNHFNSELRFYSRADFKTNRAAALAEWRQLGAAQGTVILSMWRPVRICLTPPVSALKAEDARVEAADLLRGLVSEIRLIPKGDGLALELVGELAALLALGEARTPNARALGTGVWRDEFGCGGRIWTLFVGTEQDAATISLTLRPSLRNLKSSNHQIALPGVEWHQGGEGVTCLLERRCPSHLGSVRGIQPIAWK